MTYPAQRQDAEDQLIITRALSLHHARAARESIVLGNFPAVMEHVQVCNRYDDAIPELMLRMDRLGIIEIGKQVLNNYRETLETIIADCERLKNQGEEAANV